MLLMLGNERVDAPADGDDGFLQSGEAWRVHKHR